MLKMINKVIREIKSCKLIIFHTLVNGIAGAWIVPLRVRNILYKIAGMRINTRMISAKNIFLSKKVSIGTDSFINTSCVFEGWVTIGNNVYIGMGCTFVTSNHKIGEPIKRAGELESKPIYIEDGCWIGANCTILPGVTIRKGTVIASGSVVKNDCESNSLYAGVPARLKRMLD